MISLTRRVYRAWLKWYVTHYRPETMLPPTPSGRAITHSYYGRGVILHATFVYFTWTANPVLSHVVIYDVKKADSRRIDY